jgi:DNA-binding response OmpR family regulator
MYFDKEKMTKIMSNLLSNAFKFTPEGGQITVSVTSSHAEPALPAGRFISASSYSGEIPNQSVSGRRNDAIKNSVQINVRDSGVGISEEELPKLFDIFYQVDNSQTREHEGTGIGLALTKELVELHYGKISVTSKLEEGTEFTIMLPVGRSHLKDEEVVEIEEPIKDDIIVDQDDFVLSISEESGKSEVNDENKNIILIVEDNADVREFIKDSLGNDFQIEEASNGEQGVRKAEKIIPDLIISDIMMPKMDGNELTRILKNDEKTSHIPIILLTAKSEQESKLEGLETGADAFLTKPFDAKELQIRINNLISIRRKLQERYSSGDYRPVKRKEGKKLTNREEQFINKVMEVIDEHISEEEFSIDQFGIEIGMSSVQIYRKLKALTGKSPSLYIRSIRLVRAKKMIEEQKGNISEIAYSVGFGSPSYFTRCFKEEYGYPPSDLAS